MKKPKKLAITGRIQKKEAVETAIKVIGFLGKKKVLFEVDSFFPVAKNTLPMNAINADIVLCFGGDGSLLHTFHELKKNIPVIGVNCGARGTLTAMSKENVLRKLPHVLSGKFVAEKRERLKVFADGKEIGQALNEALVVPLKPGRLLKYRLFVDGKDLGMEADDGVIVATPTGSTAHAMSAGGPQVVFDASVFVIVRMNPLDLNRRPLVVNDHSEIEIEVQKPVQLIIDGQKEFTAHKKVTIRKGKSVFLAKAK